MKKNMKTATALHTICGTNKTVSTMKKTNLLATLPVLILTAFIAACADDHATDNDQKQNPEKVGTVFIGTPSRLLTTPPRAPRLIIHSAKTISTSFGNPVILFGAAIIGKDLRLILPKDGEKPYLHRLLNIQTKRYRLPFAALIVGHLMQ